MSQERIQKLLAHLGVASRRKIEEWIKEGRVKVNGKPAGLGDKIDRNAKVVIDNKPISLTKHEHAPHQVLMVNKPIGVICSRNDPENRPVLFDDLPALTGQRWVAVGRLDINTSGLILVTTDGELANRLMHPEYELEREYLVRVKGTISDSDTQRLKKGVELDDGLASFKRIKHTGGSGLNQWYKVVLAEGRNREIRRLFEALGYEVNRLIRTRYGPLSLSRNARRGEQQALKEKQVQKLYELVGLEY